MAELTDETKIVIVRLLAQFVSPATIVERLGEEGIVCDRRQVGSYDPTRPYFEAGQKWVPLFEEERKRFIEDLAAIPSTNKAFRINLLHEAAMEAREKGEKGAMAGMLKQIAEETGGVLTNERNVNLNGTVNTLTADERREALGKLLAQAIGQTAPTSEASH